MLGGGFRGAVGVCRIERSVLPGDSVGDASIYLVSRTVEKEPYGVGRLSACFEQARRPHDIVRHKPAGLVERLVYARLRRNCKGYCRFCNFDMIPSHDGCAAVVQTSGKVVALLDSV